MEQGQEIGTLARKLYPAGILITTIAGKTPYEITQGHTASAVWLKTLAEVDASTGVAKLAVGISA